MQERLWQVFGKVSELNWSKSFEHRFRSMVKKKKTFGLCPLALSEDNFSVYLGAHHWRYFTRAGVWAADTGGQCRDMFSVLAQKGLTFGL